MKIPTKIVGINFAIGDKNANNKVDISWQIDFLGGEPEVDGIKDVPLSEAISLMGDLVGRARKLK